MTKTFEFVLFCLPFFPPLFFHPSFVVYLSSSLSLSFSLSCMFYSSSTILLCPLVFVRCSSLTYHDRFRPVLLSPVMCFVLLYPRNHYFMAIYFFSLCIRCCERTWRSKYGPFLVSFNLTSSRPEIPSLALEPPPLVRETRPSKR
jgi:hypothetical protein